MSNAKDQFLDELFGGCHQRKPLARCTSFADYVLTQFVRGGNLCKNQLSDEEFATLQGLCEQGLLSTPFTDLHISKDFYDTLVGCRDNDLLGACLLKLRGGGILKFMGGKL